MNSSYYCWHCDRAWCQRHTIWHSHRKNVGIILSIFTWRHGDHVGVQKDSEKVFWECQSIIMQNLSDVLPLFCTPNWPSHHVSENQELDSWRKQYVERRTHDKEKNRKKEWERERNEKHEPREKFTLLRTATTLSPFFWTTSLSIRSQAFQNHLVNMNVLLGQLQNLEIRGKIC